MSKLTAPKVGKLILPSLTIEEVNQLLEVVNNIRDKAIISLLTESGLRLSELVNVQSSDIDWEARIIRTVEKGKKGQILSDFNRFEEYQFQIHSTRINPAGVIRYLRSRDVIHGCLSIQSKNRSFDTISPLCLFANWIILLSSLVPLGASSTLALIMNAFNAPGLSILWTSAVDMTKIGSYPALVRL